MERIEWLERALVEAEQMITNQNVEGGLAMLTQMLYEEPGYAALHNHIGWAHTYYTGNVAAAELHLRAAMKFRTDHSGPYQHMAHIYMNAGRYAEAIVVLNEGLQVANPNRVAIYDLLGRAHELRQQFAEAAKSYRAAIMASVSTEEAKNFSASIRRCRRKRLMSIFG